MQGGDEITAQLGGFEPNQDYVILSKKKNTMALDISKNPKQPNKLILWKRHDEDNQRFTIRGEKGRYILTSRFGNKVLQVPNNSKASGQEIGAGQSTESRGEQWDIVPVMGLDNVFCIKSFCGKYLDAKGDSMKPETKLIQWEYNGGQNQKWYIKKIPNLIEKKEEDPSHDFIILSGTNRELALDYCQENRQLLLNQRTDQANQRWQLIKVGGLLVLQSKLGGVLKVTDTSKNGSRIRVGKRNFENSQNWALKIIEESTMKCFIHAFSSGRALDVSEGKITPGMPITQGDFHGGDSQIWYLQKL